MVKEWNSCNWDYEKVVFISNNKVKVMTIKVYIWKSGRQGHLLTGLRSQRVEKIISVYVENAKV